MGTNRLLFWEGCNNVRDLGDLATSSGSRTRRGAIVRADDPNKLTPSGWSALYDYGIRTIISLQTDGLDEQRQPDLSPRPGDLTTLKLAVEDFSDAEFVQKWVDTDLWCTPLYYRDALERWPQRHAAVITAVAFARPGGILIHCSRGNDRTGIISMLLLALAGVTPEEIVADYELSLDEYRETLLQQKNTTPRDVLLAALAWLEPQAYLQRSGLTPAVIEAARTRLL